MRVDQLTLRDFTVFEPADFQYSPGLNVLIGANGTGKSHVLKVLYSILRPLASPATDVVPRMPFFSTSDPESESLVRQKLFSVFRPDPASTSNSGHGAFKSLTSHGTNHFNIEASGDFGSVVLDWAIHDRPRPYFHIDFVKFTRPRGHAVFVPTFEVL